MSKAGIYIAFILALMSRLVGAQSPLEQRVTLHYDGSRLGAVLQDISDKYQIRFIYGYDYLSVDDLIFIHMDDRPLSTALDTIFDHTPIIYHAAGTTVILKEDESKRSRLELLSSTTFDTPFWQEREDQKKERLRLGSRLPEIPGPEFKELPGGDRVEELNLDKYRLSEVIFEGEDEKAEEGLKDHSMVQVSILPFLGTNAYRSHEMSNNFSINIFWGANGGVDGVEIGGFVNTIVEDVKGMQIAGFGNTVGGSLIGTQVAGLFNINQGNTHGLQFGGMFNLTNETDAVQIAGIFNLARQDAAGTQVGGFFNVGAGKAGSQIATLFNHSSDSTRMQVAGLFNAAGDIHGGQVSALFNKARRVNGFQFGLVNVADTVSGVSLGVFNFVKRGYNRVEVGANEVLFANLGLKLGTRGLYNILHVGARWDHLKPTIGGTSYEGVYMSWGLGYGIGTAVTLSSRWRMNIEAVAIHVNEYESWTKRLNLLSQLRLTIDKQSAGRASFFFGPVGNLMASRLVDQEGVVTGSSVPPYALLDKTSGETNYKAWIGGYLGLRF